MEARTIETRRLKLPQLWRYNEVTHASEILAFIEHATLIWKYCTFKMQRTSEVGPCMTLAWQLIFTLIFTSNITYTHTHTSTLHQHTQVLHTPAQTPAHTHSSTLHQHTQVLHTPVNCGAAFPQKRNQSPPFQPHPFAPERSFPLKLPLTRQCPLNTCTVFSQTRHPACLRTSCSSPTRPTHYQHDLRSNTQPAYAPAAAAPCVPTHYQHDLRHNTQPAYAPAAAAPWVPTHYQQDIRHNTQPAYAPAAAAPCVTLITKRISDTTPSLLTHQLQQPHAALLPCKRPVVGIPQVHSYAGQPPPKLL